MAAGRIIAYAVGIVLGFALGRLMGPLESTALALALLAGARLMHP